MITYYTTGDEIDITIPLKNNKGERALNVSVEVNIPDGLEIVSMTIPIGSWNGTEWTLATLDVGENLTAILRVRVIDGMELPSNVTWVVTSDNFQINPDNNASFVTINGVGDIMKAFCGMLKSYPTPDHANADSSLPNGCPYYLDGSIPGTDKNHLLIKKV